MLSLNLLSPNKKLQISKQMIFTSLQFFASWILIIICFTGIILLITKLIMQNSFNQAVRQSSLVTKEYGDLNQKVHLANNKINFLHRIQKNFIVWSPKLTAISTMVPHGIELSYININHITGDIEINGNAKTRDDLLLYKTQLEQSNILEKINLPIENLLEANDVDFRINGKLSL